MLLIKWHVVHEHLFARMIAVCITYQRLECKMSNNVRGFGRISTEAKFVRKREEARKIAAGGGACSACYAVDRTYSTLYLYSAYQYVMVPDTID